MIIRLCFERISFFFCTGVCTHTHTHSSDCIRLNGAFRFCLTMSHKYECSGWSKCTASLTCHRKTLQSLCSVQSTRAAVSLRHIVITSKLACSDTFRGCYELGLCSKTETESWRCDESSYELHHGKCRISFVLLEIERGID